MAFPLLYQIQHNIGDLLPPMLRPHNQIAKPSSLALSYLPLLIGLHIAEPLHGDTAIFNFFRVDQVDIGAVPTILESFGLSLNIVDDIVVKVRRCADLQLLDFGLKVPVNLLFSSFEMIHGSGFEHDALL